MGQVDSLPALWQAISLPHSLKHVLQAELDLAHRGVGAPDLPERGWNRGAGSRARIWSAEHRVIEEIERFKAERKRVIFQDTKRLVSGEVPRLLGRPDHGIPSDIPHHARGREGFARGAVMAAALLRGRKGFFRFDELVMS